MPKRIATLTAMLVVVVFLWACQADPASNLSNLAKPSPTPTPVKLDPNIHTIIQAIMDPAINKKFTSLEAQASGALNAKFNIGKEQYSIYYYGQGSCAFLSINISVQEKGKTVNRAYIVDELLDGVPNQGYHGEAQPDPEDKESKYFFTNEPPCESLPNYDEHRGYWQTELDGEVSKILKHFGKTELLTDRDL